MQLLRIGVAVFVVALGAESQQRVPGRVGGSTNNPAASRPNAHGALTDDEEKEFANCSQLIPKLTKSDYIKLQYLAKQLSHSGANVTTEQLAKEVGPAGEVTPALLRLLNSSPAPRQDNASTVKSWEKAADKYVARRCGRSCE